MRSEKIDSNIYAFLIKKIKKLKINSNIYAFIKNRLEYICKQTRIYMQIDSNIYAKKKIQIFIPSKKGDG